MGRIDTAELRMLRETAKERSRRIAQRMDRIEADRLRLWTRMERLRAAVDGRAQGAGADAYGEDVLRVTPV